MTLNIGKRMLMLLHWLCSLMICLVLALCLIVPGLQASLISRAEAALGLVGSRILGAVLLALYIALSVAQFCMIIRRKKRAERGFITVGSDEKGRVRIAVSAVEQMVRQSVRAIDGITEMKVDIEGLDDAIAIGINAAIAGGRHVPTITSNMQRSITQFVEVNCGVAVQSVAITINAVSGQGDLSRRRLLSRGKARQAEPVKSPVNEAPLSAEVNSDAEALPTEDMPNSPEADAAELPDIPADDAGDVRPAFDLDKPYESDFAKDLAAMRAKEAAEARDQAPQE